MNHAVAFRVRNQPVHRRLNQMRLFEAALVELRGALDGGCDARVIQILKGYGKAFRGTPCCYVAAHHTSTDNMHMLDTVSVPTCTQRLEPVL